MRKHTSSDILQSNDTLAQNGREEDTVWNPLGIQMMEIHVQELLHQAATEHLAREEGGLERSRLRWRRGWWLCRLGQSLVGIGQWLQRVGQPPAVGTLQHANWERHIGS